MSEFKKMKLSEARAKFEQIDELKGSTYKSYIRKSQDDLERHTKDARKAAAFDDGEYRDRSKFTKTPKDIYQNREAKKRVKGLDKAYKLVNKKFAKEEAELDEASSEKMHNYLKGADNNIQKRVDDGEDTDSGKLARRLKYANKAEKKLLSRGVKPNSALSGRNDIPEEAELSEMDKSPESPKFNPARLGPGSAPAKPIPVKKAYKDMADIANSTFAKARADFAKARADAKSLKKEEVDLHAVHSDMGTKKHLGTFSNLEAARKHVDKLEDKGKFPEGHDAIAHDKKTGKKYAYTDEWEPMSEESEGCMLDTSMGGADQIATSKTGEIYKKSTKQSTGPSPATGTSTHVVAGKGGEAYNTAGITKRVPAVESAALGVFEKTLEKRRIFEDASNIAIISPDQRQDWLNVSAGRMDVVDYFNKYRV